MSIKSSSEDKVAIQGFPTSFDVTVQTDRECLDRRPCPFCGAQPTKFVGAGQFFGFFRCVTLGCPAGYSDWVDPETWHTRPEEDALRSRIADLEKKLEDARQLAQTFLESAELVSGGEIPSPLPGHQGKTDEDWLAEEESLNCPLCTGSGHVDDADPTIAKEIQKLRVENVRLRAHIKELEEI